MTIDDIMNDITKRNKVKLLLYTFLLENSDFTSIHNAIKQDVPDLPETSGGGKKKYKKSYKKRKRRKHKKKTTKRRSRRRKSKN